MGWLDKVTGFLDRAVTTIVSTADYVITKTADVATAVYRAAVDELFGKTVEAGQKLDRQRRYDAESSTPQETVEADTELTDLRDGLAPLTAKLESAFRDMVEQFFESAEDTLIRCLKTPDEFDFNRVKTNSRKKLEKIPNAIRTRMMARISVDDTECKAILALRAGPEKRKRAKVFLETVLGEGFTELGKAVGEATAEFQSEITKVVGDKVEGEVATLRKHQQELVEIERALSEGAVAKERHQTAIRETITYCESVKQEFEADAGVTPTRS